MLLSQSGDEGFHISVREYLNDYFLSENYHRHGAQTVLVLPESVCQEPTRSVNTAISRTKVGHNETKIYLPAFPLTPDTKIMKLR